MPEVYTRQLLRQINEFVRELYYLICNQEPYESLVPFVEAFVRDHTGKPLSAGGIFPGDPSDLRSVLADENLFRITRHTEHRFMRGYILEILAGRSWQRDGQTFWTKSDAEREARRILRRGKAVEVRILPVEIGNTAVECLSSGPAEMGSNGRTN